MKGTSTGLIAAALSCVSAPALAAPCQGSTVFTDFFAGGPQANCTVADKSILGVSWNEIAQSQGLEVLPEPTPPSDPGLLFIPNTILFSENGASFVYTVTAPSSSPMFGFSLFLNSSSTTGTIDVSLSNGDNLSVTGGGHMDSVSFPALTSLTVTTTVLSTGLDDNHLAIQENFSEVAPAVPEPSSLALVGIGLSLTALRLRRRGARSA